MTAKTKIPTLGEKMKEAGIGVGFDDDLDLEKVDVKDLCKNETDFVIYAAKEMPDQFGEEDDTVFLVQLGDEKGITHKCWMRQTVLHGKLESMVLHNMFPVSTRIIMKPGKKYYEFKL